MKLASVKVASMDAEHAECAGTLRRLAREGSTSALQAVRACLAEHFSHEEALFDQYGFGGSDERFSARKTHVDDHSRMLESISAQLSATAAGEGRVASGFVRKLLDDFQEHANKYDAMYAEFLSSRGAG